MFKKCMIAGSAAAILAVGSAQAEDTVKVGIVTTLTTPAAVIGKQMKAGFEVAYDHLGGQIAGKKLELIFEDDGFKPKIGKQKTEKLVKRDKVDFLTGYIWSHVLNASAPVGFKAGKIVISANAGHSVFAGKRCNKNFFNAAWENEQTSAAMGEYLNQIGVKSLYVLAPNYAAGKQMISGVEKNFKGKIVGKDLTPTSHKDWSAELSKIKAANPDGVYVFYPGAWGPAFFTQYKQAGLSGKIPLYNVFSIDGANLPRFQKAKMDHLIGMINTGHWAPDLDNAANKRFVADFRKKYRNEYPAHYAAQAYDALMMIAAAVEQSGGDPKNVDGVRAAMEQAKFASVRGPFKFCKNHFPVQNFYARKVVKDKDGTWVMSKVGLVFKDNAPYNSSECKL
ncbi:MAG: ABC transporter substrate-binding protein [Rhodospirillales bacterium]|nr:ABC transporter substrate-binding protein [Rhodospirillales bacterium]